MFTLDQIQEASNKVKTGADFPQFVQELKKIGVTHYDNFVETGLTKYYGADNFVLEGEPICHTMAINDESSAEDLTLAISIHQQGQTDYPTFCRQAADAGVEKWTTDMTEMTVTYFDKEGNHLLVEPIPS